jgi:hypothetical protein
MTPPPTESFDDLPLKDLRRVVATLVAEVGRLREAESVKDDEIALLKAKIVEQADEITRLKNLPKRPKFKGRPSGMEQATSRPKVEAGADTGAKRGRGSKRDKLRVTREVKLKATHPPGARFRGYEDVLVQDLKISVEVVRYRRERWETAEGERIVAAMPAGIMGGFGPELRRFITAGHFQGQVTSERLMALLNGMGLEISKRQVVRLLSQGLEELVAEDVAVLKAGLATADWISVDDTTARHAREDCFATQLGDDRFTVFRTGPSKSRINFLSVLQAGETAFLIDDEALAYMKGLHMSASPLALLAAHPDKRFTDEAAWNAHLEALGLDQLEVHPNPVDVATEGALWAAVKEQGLLGETVIVSDGAGQFRLTNNALCWVHSERLVHKPQPTNPIHRQAVEVTRTLIWWFYRDLKAYKLAPDPKRARMMRARFDRIFTRKTGYILLDQLLTRLHRRKADLLRVLDRPEIPLHTNGSENDIRAFVTKRKISGGTVSHAGRTARDVMLGLAKTCAKQGLSFYRFLGDRFAVPGATPIPNLADLVTAAA